MPAAGRSRFPRPRRDVGFDKRDSFPRNPRQAASGGPLGEPPKLCRILPFPSSLPDDLRAELESTVHQGQCLLFSAGTIMKPMCDNPHIKQADRVSSPLSDPRNLSFLLSRRQNFTNEFEILEP